MGLATVAVPKTKAVVVPASAPAPALTMAAVRTSAKKARKRIRGNAQQSKTVGIHLGTIDGTQTTRVFLFQVLLPMKVPVVLENGRGGCPTPTTNQLALALEKQNAHTKIVTGDFAKSSASLDEKACVHGMASSFSGFGSLFVIGSVRTMQED
jgi:hypothetical protein